MLKIIAMSIIVLFLASALVLPVALSYAQTTNGTVGTPSYQAMNGQTGMNYGNHTGFGHNRSMNQTAMTPSGINQTAMMSPGMNGMSKSAMPTNTTVTPPMMAPKILPPLKQVKSGVAPKAVQCKQGFTLILKAEDGSPACVDPMVSQILLQRGWSATS